VIQLEVDEGYAFDYLSILQGKLDKRLIPAEFLERCAVHLEAQLGAELFSRIMASTEYQAMLAVNAKTFDAVEKAKKNEIPAKVVDDCNLERYHAKRALQARFFNTEVTEAKTP
jgi:hypothetical protein